MRPLIFVLGIALLGMAAWTSFRLLQRPPLEALPVQAEEVNGELPRLWAVPEFTLTERSGKAVTLADLQGSVWVADFFYTSCPGPCPMLSSRLSELAKGFGAEPGVRFVSISSDPEKDTPAVLQKYAEHFHASNRWLFLTGDKTAVYALANQGFRLAVAEEKGAAEPIIHSTKLALVDRQGVVRGFYDGLDSAAGERLRRDMLRLLAEKP